MLHEEKAIQVFEIFKIESNMKWILRKSIWFHGKYKFFSNNIVDWCWNFFRLIHCEYEIHIINGRILGPLFKNSESGPGTSGGKKVQGIPLS